ncbi:MAG: class I SAM-dependent methyltransferase [Chloroflexi bacterium]|nr:MAG: class I SAM-dependent methyltransferase [Chloroflexota bacterium]
MAKPGTPAELAWTPQFVCPRCATSLTTFSSGTLGCGACQTAVPLRDGIYRCLRPERLKEIEPFLAHYRRVREEDGYRHRESAYYRSLPRVDPHDAQAARWRVRHESFRHLVRVLLRLGRRPLRILDLGAGNGWLSHRLTALGHRCVALDWLDDVEDGLGAQRHYPVGFTCVQADFDELPLAPGQFDLAVFNASLHYSPDFVGTLRHARGMLVAGGALVVMDSPVFATEQGGHRMLAAQQIDAGAMHRSVVQWGEGYLTKSGLARAGRDARVGVRWIPSRGGPSWAARRWLAGLKERREPAKFGIWLGGWPPARPDGARPLGSCASGPGSPESASQPEGPAVNRSARGPISLRGGLWRWWLRLRHQTLGRRYRRLVLERVDGVPLVVLPEVFNPVLFRTGVFLARSVRPPDPAGAAEPRALDVGTGSGIGAIFASRLGYRVVGVDLNPEAVRCARLNVLLNDVEGRVEIRSGDLFAPVAGNQFDLVLFNPPFFRGTPADRLDLAWRATDVIERFAGGLGGALSPSGEALIVLSTDGESRAMLAALDAAAFAVRPVARRDFGNEILTVYSARRRTPGASSA